jgi:hypothetical protein
MSSIRGKNKKSEIIRAIPIAILQEAITLKVWKKTDKTITNGILNKTNMAFLYKTKPALRRAIKTESIRFDNVNNTARIMKVA